MSPKHWRDAKLGTVEIIEPTSGDVPTDIHDPRFANLTSAAPEPAPDLEKVAAEVKRLKAEGTDVFKLIQERLDAARVRLVVGATPNPARDCNHVHIRTFFQPEANRKIAVCTDCRAEIRSHAVGETEDVLDPVPPGPASFIMWDEGARRRVVRQRGDEWIGDIRCLWNGEELSADLSECTDEQLWGLMVALEHHRPKRPEKPDLDMLLEPARCHACNAFMYRGDVFVSVPIERSPACFDVECPTCARPRILKAFDAHAAAYNLWRARMRSVESLHRSARERGA